MVRRRVTECEPVYARLGWRLPSSLSRVYDNARARRDLRWSPRHDFRGVIARLAEGGDAFSALQRTVGSKPYHAQTFADGPYPVE